MNRLIVYSLMILILTQCIYADNLTKQTASINKNLSNFKQKQFNDISLYRDISKNFCIEGTKFHQLALINMVKYYKKDIAQKIVLYFDSRDANATSEYYYQKGKLFFVYQTIYRFKHFKDDEDFDENQYIKEENNCYLDKNMLTRWTKNNNKGDRLLLNQLLLYFPQ